MTEGNPFLTLAKLMTPTRDGYDPKMVVGKVTKLSPLTVDAAGLVLSGPALMVSAELTSDKDGTIRGTGYMSATVTGSCHIAAPLAANDEVVMLTTDWQKFFIICKVVSA